MGRDQISKRRKNQYAVLRALHFGGSLSRGRISAITGIRKSSITSIVAELLGLNVVREERPGNTRSRIRLDNEHFHTLSLSVTTRTLKVCRVFLDGRMEEIAHHDIEGRTTPDVVLPLLSQEIKAATSAGLQHVVGIAVAVPGIVDPIQGRALYVANLMGWKQVAIRETIQNETGLDVFVDNDVRCQLWACAWFDRWARETGNFVYLTLHEGIACALMTHGQRITGEHFSAGEIGHIRAGDEGRLCSCGRTDCLEAYCSIPAIQAEIWKVRPGLQILNARAIVKAAREDPAIINILDRIAQRMSRAIAPLVVSIDPRALILGSPDQAFSELMQPLLQRHLYSELLGLFSQDAEIRIAGEVEDNTIRGAAGLVIDHAFKEGRFSLA